MTTFTIEVKDDGVHAGLNALAERVANMQPVLQSIGEDIVARTKERFGTQTDPAGNRWRPNVRATIEAYLAKKSGIYSRYSKISTREEGLIRSGTKKGYFDENGKIKSRGVQAIMNKLVLHGESGDLARQINVRVAGGTLTVSASPIYAAIQQFGGQAGRGKKVTIPARPFLPVTSAGDLYPAERERIIETINRFIVGGL